MLPRQWRRPRSQRGASPLMGEKATQLPPVPAGTATTSCEARGTSRGLCHSTHHVFECSIRPQIFWSPFSRIVAASPAPTIRRGVRLDDRLAARRKRGGATTAPRRCPLRLPRIKSGVATSPAVRGRCYAIVEDVQLRWARYQSRICSPVQNRTPGCFRMCARALRTYLRRCGAPMM